MISKLPPQLTFDHAVAVVPAPAVGGFHLRFGLEGAWVLPRAVDVPIGTWRSEFVRARGEQRRPEGVLGHRVHRAGPTQLDHH